jgi:hypothetical protein
MTAAQIYLEFAIGNASMKVRLTSIVPIGAMAWLVACGTTSTPTPAAITLLPGAQTQLVETATALALTARATHRFDTPLAPTETTTPMLVATETQPSLPTPTAPAETQPPAPTVPPPQPTLTSATPAILSFTIEPARINPGEPITLAWATTGEAVTISPISALGQWSPPIHTGPPTGTLVITTSAEARNLVMYVVTASLGEQHAWQSATVQLNCPDTWFFSNPPAQCPWPAHFTVMQAQRLERGLMLWTQWNDAVYVLYDQPHWYRWDRFPNQWFPGMPESDPTITPPVGRLQPVRGFGVAWRTGYVSPTQLVRDLLGWAVEEEQAVPDAAFQCDTKPKYASCYISGPGGAVYVLGPEHTGGGVWGGPAP